MHHPPHACTCPLHPFSYARNRSSTSFPILNIFNPFLNCYEFHNKCKKSKPTLSSHSSIACMHCSIPHVSGSRSVVHCLVRVQRKRLLLQLIQRMSLRCVHMSMTASTWFKARSSTVFMPNALARPHPPAGLAHVLALPVRPANEPNGPPRSLCPAGPALLASAHPALAAPDRPAHTPTCPPHVHSRSFFFGHCINILEKNNHILVVHRDKEQIKCNKLNKNK